MNISDIKVLVCDDSVLVRRKMTGILEALGVTQIFQAVDGMDAIIKYKEINPDVTFMDIIMPVKTGVEALATIKEYDRKAKVIMASSAGTQNNLKEAIDAGAYNFIQKPVTKEQIAKLLTSL